MDWEAFCQEMKHGLSGDYYEAANKKRHPQFGDIICIDRHAYYHYGIYISDRRIIHYAPRIGEKIISKNAIVHPVSLQNFLRGSETFFVCNCPNLPVLLGFIPDFAAAFVGDYKLYTPQETVTRAESKLGEDKYSLLFNNCEHFSFWCKTGIKETLQAFNFLKGVRMDKIEIKVK